MYPPNTGYPLNALSDPCKKPLISLIRSCPPLVQESIFRYCLDTLLTEVRTVLPTYGSRIILQLLINCKPSTCTECTQKVCKVRWILEHFISSLNHRSSYSCNPAWAKFRKLSLCCGQGYHTPSYTLCLLWMHGQSCASPSCTLPLTSLGKYSTMLSTTPVFY